MIKVAVLTVSDSCSQGKREDLSGQVILDMLPKGKFEVCGKNVVADDVKAIAEQLTYFSDKAGVDIILTTGGTGLGPRDVTPEATQSVCQKMVPGFCEIMRSEGFKKTPNAVLSRAVAGVRNNTLIINMPGSPRSVKESLEIILGILPHAFEMLKGAGH